MWVLPLRCDDAIDKANELELTLGGCMSGWRSMMVMGGVNITLEDETGSMNMIATRLELLTLHAT